jgi:hypothetical protein
MLTIVFRWRHKTLSRFYSETAYYRFFIHMFLCATLGLLGYSYSSVQWWNGTLLAVGIVWLIIAVMHSFRS